MAALDRQHPATFLMCTIILENEGLTDELRTAFIVYLISHDYSPVSLLALTMKDIRHGYEKNFVGMTEGKLLWIPSCRQGTS